MDNLFFEVNLSGLDRGKLPYNKGVYEIRNLVTQMSYIGSSYSSLASRVKSHLCLLKTGRHTNKQLQRDWDTHGVQNFKFKLLEPSEDKWLTIKTERRWIMKKWSEASSLYNRCIPKESGYLPPDIEAIRDSNRSAKINSNIARDIFTDYHVNTLRVEEITSKYSVSRGIVVKVINRRSWVHATQAILTA